MACLPVGQNILPVGQNIPDEQNDPCEYSDDLEDSEDYYQQSYKELIDLTKKQIASQDEVIHMIEDILDKKWS